MITTAIDTRAAPAPAGSAPPATQAVRSASADAIPAWQNRGILGGSTLLEVIYRVDAFIERLTVGRRRR